MAQFHPVTSIRYPFLRVRGDIRGHPFEAEAPVDTGFTGYLALPLEFLGTNVGLPDTRSDWEVADGRRVDAPVYFATLEIVGLPAFRGMIIALGSEWILGRSAIDRYRVTFDRGQRVIVQP